MLDCALCPGSLISSAEGVSGNLPSTVSSARWAFTVRPLLGWGATDERQKATAGWLASLPVFEPHWQVPPSPLATSLPCSWEKRQHSARW